MIINLTSSVCFMIILIILVVDFFSKKKVSKLENKYFKYLSILTLFGLLLEIIIYTLAVMDYTKWELAFTNLGRMIFMYYVIWMFFFTLYNFIICFNINYDNVKNYKLLKISIILIYSIIFIFVLFLPIEFIKTKSFIYPSGKLLTFSYGFGSIGVTLLLLICIFKIKVLRF